MKDKLGMFAFEAIQKIESLREGLKNVDPIKLTAKIPNPAVRNRVLDIVMSFGIPFNRWLGLHIDEIGPEKVVIISPPRKLRENHVRGTHACCLALIGEYAAGMCIAHHYGVEEHRLIIGALNIDYHKQGRGTLRGEALAPTNWPELEDGEAWIDMTTKITDEKGEEVATCRTKWQLKDWSQVGKKRSARATNGAGTSEF